MALRFKGLKGTKKEQSRGRVHSEAWEGFPSKPSEGFDLFFCSVLFAFLYKISYIPDWLL